jgi:hypothetical protein
MNPKSAATSSPPSESSSGCTTVFLVRDSYLRKTTQSTQTQKSKSHNFTMSPTQEARAASHARCRPAHRLDAPAAFFPLPALGSRMQRCEVVCFRIVKRKLSAFWPFVPLSRAKGGDQEPGGTTQAMPNLRKRTRTTISDTRELHTHTLEHCPLGTSKKAAIYIGALTARLARGCCRCTLSGLGIPQLSDRTWGRCGRSAFQR